MNFNREIIFTGYRANWGGLKQDQVDALNDLLDFFEADPYMTDLRWIAYALATTQHETAGTFEPIKERGGRAYFIRRYGSQTAIGRQLGNDTPEEGADYAGHGYVQTTGETNYEKIEKAIRKQYPDVVARFEARTGRKFDLTVGDQSGDEKDPENLMDPELSYLALSIGMREGIYTGKKLSDFITDDVADYYYARRIINPNEIRTRPDWVRRIAKWASNWERILIDAKIQEEEIPQPKPEPEASAATSKSETTTTTKTEIQQSVLATPGDNSGFVQASANTFKRFIAWLTGLGVSVVTMAAGLYEFARTHPVLATIIVVTGLLALVGGTLYYQNLMRDMDKKRMDIAADPTKMNVK